MNLTSNIWNSVQTTHNCPINSSQDGYSKSLKCTPSLSIATAAKRVPMIARARQSSSNLHRAPWAVSSLTDMADPRGTGQPQTAKLKSVQCLWIAAGGCVAWSDCGSPVSIRFTLCNRPIRLRERKRIRFIAQRIYYAAQPCSTLLTHMCIGTSATRGSTIPFI